MRINDEVKIIIDLIRLVADRIVVIEQGISVVGIVLFQEKESRRFIFY